MGELSEDAKRLLRRILGSGRVAYDSLSENERKAAEELIRLGYVKVYLEPSGKRIGDVLKVIGTRGKIGNTMVTYACIAIIVIIASVFSVLLYLTIKAFIMNYASVGAFLLLINVLIMYIAYLIIKRRYPRCLRILKPLLS
ncbi:MAG: hypothetical protein RXN78_02470 [Vulcanisaeta sp.]